MCHSFYCIRLLKYEAYLNQSVLFYITMSIQNVMSYPFIYPMYYYLRN